MTLIVIPTYDEIQRLVQAEIVKDYLATLTVSIAVGEARLEGE